MRTVSEQEIEIYKWLDELKLSAIEKIPIQIQFATGFFLIRDILEKKEAQNKNYVPKQEQSTREVTN